MSEQVEKGQKQRFLRLPQVLEIFPVSKSTWWAGIREGKYPKQVKLSQKISAWRESDIDELCNRLGRQTDDLPSPCLCTKPLGREECDRR
jgi:predicted DNA-binding transcriptional regulator AlpA